MEKNCASEDEINKYIENNSIYVSLFLESASVDHYNYTYPITKKYYQNSKDFIFSYTFSVEKLNIIPEILLFCLIIYFKNQLLY